MKKTRRIIALILAIIAISTTGVYASEADTPMKEYVRGGVAYRMISVTMEESVPEYNEFLLGLAKELFDEKPLIYGYLIDSRMNELYGYQVTYSDGSKAIYINENLTFKKGTQVFIHEMLHYKYDVAGSLMYQKDDNGYFKYRELMEILTDEIAKRAYAKISTNVYEKAYESKVIDSFSEEEVETLIKLYKGEILLDSEGEKAINLLNEAVKTDNVDTAKEAIAQIKKSIVERKREDISLSFFIFFRTKNVKFAKSKEKCYNIHNYLTKEKNYENYTF